MSKITENTPISELLEMIGIKVEGEPKKASIILEHGSQPILELGYEREGGRGINIAHKISEIRICRPDLSVDDVERLVSNEREYTACSTFDALDRLFNLASAGERLPLDKGASQ